MRKCRQVQIAADFKCVSLLATAVQIVERGGSVRGSEAQRASSASWGGRGLGEARFEKGIN